MPLSVEICVKPFPSPCGWLVEHTTAIPQRGRKLTLSQGRFSDVLVERGILLQHATGVSLRVDDAYGFAKFAFYLRHGEQQVGVATQDNGTLEEAPVGIHEKVGGKVNVGTLLFGFDDFDEGGLSGRGCCHWHSDGVGEKMPVVHFEFRDRAQSSKVGFLPTRLVGIMRSGRQAGREVFDAADIMPGEEYGTEFAKVKPLEGRSTDCSEVEVEGVHIDIRLHARPLSMKKARATPFPRQLCARSPKLLRGVSMLYFIAEWGDCKQKIKFSGTKAFGSCTRTNCGVGVAQW